MIYGVSTLKIRSESLEVRSAEQCELQGEMDYLPLENEQERRSGVVKEVRIKNICFLCVAALLVYVPYINVILGRNRGAVIPQPFEPACQNQCAVNVPLSSVQEFNSFSLDRSHVVFVHFHANNLSLQTSYTTDILDPLNLVWGESIEAPILSLDLGFNVYSFTTLSRVVHHMKVKIENQSLSCLQNLNHSCLTATLAKSFLGTVTKERGVLCYAVNDTNTVNYRCCKGDVRTRQAECDIPALSPEMTAIFKLTAIAAAFAILYFPAIFNIIPDKENSETLSSNIQVHNPLFQIGIRAIQALQNASDNCKLDTGRKLVLSAALPILYYVDLGLTYHIKTYDIPQMFNDCVKEFWAQSKIIVLMTNDFLPLWVIMSLYAVVVVLFSLLPRTEKLKFSSSNRKNFAEVVHSMIQEEKDLKVNWSMPCYLTKRFFRWLISCFKETWEDQGSFCCKTLMSLASFVLLVLFPVETIFIFVGYTLYTSPLGQTIFPILNRAHIYNKKSRDYLPSHRTYAWYIVTFVLFALKVFVLALAIIFKESLLLSSRFIVYLWMGLVVSKDYYFPRIAVFSFFAYYAWNVCSSVASRYQKLLQQTFEKCKELQGQQPNTRKALTFDGKGKPRISSELFQIVIDEILPRSETYTNMILKLLLIVFLYLTLSSSLVFSISDLDKSTQALAVLLTALVPKLIEIFGQGSVSQQLCDMENECRVEKIVKKFLDQNNGNSEDKTSENQDEEQSPTMHDSSMSEGAHSNDNSEMSSDDNGRKCKGKKLDAKVNDNPRAVYYISSV